MKYEDIIDKRNWDYLIILDACRYDYFKKYYKDFIQGTLHKIKSCATFTMEWLSKCFPKKYEDIVYISGNPFINDLSGTYNHRGFSFDARKKFHKVINVWDWGWDNRGFVPPENVNKGILKNLEKYKDKRFIIHYMQPHTPYIKFNIEKEREAKTLIHRGKAYKLLKAIRKAFPFLANLKSRIFKNTKTAETTYCQHIYKKYGEETLRDLYKNNLKLVLEQVKKLIPHLKGKIVIISDHGELLGEDGKAGHLFKDTNKSDELLYVPYLEVKNEQQ